MGHEWINMKKIKTDCNCGFRELVRKTVFQSSGSNWNLEVFASKERRNRRETFQSNQEESEHTKKAHQLA